MANYVEPILRELMPHQKEALEWAKDRKHFGLFMEMRLGKTLAYIRWIVEKPDVQYILVIAPITVLNSWQKELAAEGEETLDVYLSGDTRSRLALMQEGLTWELPGKRLWVLFNYEALLKMEDVASMKWDAVVLDESTRIKNPQAKTTKICVFGFRGVKYRAILSGLPAPESPLDFYTQFQFLHGGFMDCGNYWTYRSKYFQINEWIGKWEPKRGMFDFIHHTVQQKAFVKRRADCKVGSKKIREVRKVSLTPQQYKDYYAVERNFESYDGTETQWAIVVYTWLARMAGGFYHDCKPFHDAKIRELLTLLEGELKGEQCVVWFRFNEELFKVREALSMAGISSVSILGETEVAERGRVLSTFNAGRSQILLGQIKCAKYGVDASGADTAIYYSNGFSLEDRSQSEDRIVHPKKSTPLLILDLATKGTVDEDVLGALEEKGVTAQSFMMTLKKKFNMRVKGY